MWLLFLKAHYLQRKDVYLFANQSCSTGKSYYLFLGVKLIFSLEQMLLKIANQVAEQLLKFWFFFKLLTFRSKYFESLDKRVFQKKKYKTWYLFMVRFYSYSHDESISSVFIGTKI